MIAVELTGFLLFGGPRKAEYDLAPAWVEALTKQNVARQALPVRRVNSPMKGAAAVKMAMLPMSA
jgi:hypothetical protein